MTQPAIETPAAPDTTLAPKPGEPATPAAAPPAPDPDAALRAAAKARSDAHKQQTAAKREREAAANERAAIARERQAIEAERASYRADPIKAMQRLGVTGDEVQSLLAGPKNETAEERVARIEAKLAEREEADRVAREEADNTARMNGYRATVREHAMAFGKFADEHDDEYPELTALGESMPNVILTEWQRVQEGVAKSGFTYSHAEMAEYLNNFARPYVEKTVQRYETAKQKKAAKSQPVDPSKAAPSTKANGADAKAGTPRTLSASLSAERSGNGTPIDRLPEKEQTAILAKMLKDSRKD